MLGMVTTQDPGTSGVKDIAEALGGGLKENSLVVIEGEAGTGKSVISEHIAYGVLRGRDTKVAYYSTEYNARALMEQMGSLGLDVDRDVVTDRLRVYRVGTGPVIKDGPKALQGLLNHMAGIPEEFQLIFFDSPSWFMTHADPMIKIDFLHVCKEFCDAGRTMVLVIDTHVFETRSLARAFAVSDYYLQLRNFDTVLETGQMDLRVVKRLQVSKLGGINRQGSEEIKFEIKPKVGIQLLPFVKVRV
jgi:flagellar protein FlaH